MIPPGIEGSWQTFVQGGSASDWLPFESEKQYTNAYVVCDGKVLNSTMLLEGLQLKASRPLDTTRLQKEGLW